MTSTVWGYRQNGEPIHDPIAASMMMADGDTRKVASTWLYKDDEERWLSTVFLVTSPDEPYYLWETALFGEASGVNVLYRYRSFEDAAKGHAIIVDNFRTEGWRLGLDSAQS